MKLFLTSIFVVLTFSCSAQTIEVGYSPVSIKGWGKLPETTKLNIGLVYPAGQIGLVSYMPGLRYTRVNSLSKAIDELDDPVEGSFNMVFALPVSFDYDLGPLAIINRFGVGLSDQSFPNDNGLPVNFLLEAGLRYPITSHLAVSMRYSHISNGYRGRTNPGVDNILLAVGIRF